MTRRCYLFFALIFAGCTPPERDRSTVEGTARFNGEPLGGFHLALYSDAAGGGSAEIKPDGAFKFAGPIQEGEYSVYFTIPVEIKGAARAKLEAVNLPQKYHRAETSDYKVNIVPGKNVLDIDLKP